MKATGIDRPPAFDIGADNYAGASMVDIEALTRSAQHMEALPASVARLMVLTSGDRWNMAAVEEVVSLDQVLTLRLLRTANSAASASATPIVTIRDAVLRMGIQSLLALSTRWRCRSD